MIEINNISKSFSDTLIIDNFSYDIKDGDFIGITGKSGSGKTTLLNIISLLENFDSGEIKFNDIKISHSKNKNIQLLKKQEIGYIYQNYGLIEEKTVLYNLLLPLNIKKNKKNIDFLKESLHSIGLQSNILNKKVYQLSGGEQQRISILRCILKKPSIIFADEPTGNLDKENSKIILDLLQQLNKDGITIVMVSHDRFALSYCSRLIELK